MPIVVVAPHRVVEPTAALALARDADSRSWLRQEIAEWDEHGVDLAQDALVEALPDAVAVRPTMPRGVMDLNRAFEVHGDGSTLLGKPAVGPAVRARLADGALETLEACYAADLARLRAASVSARVLVEVHSYGMLGSTHDRLAGGRPVPRPRSAFVVGSPWATSMPTGLARAVAPRVDASPWSVLAPVGQALAEAGFAPGPSPYPTQHPWSVSARYVAARWFAWLGERGELPHATAATLVERAWGDTRVPELDGIAAGAEEPVGFAGCAAFLERLGWSGDGLELAEAFAADASCLVVPLELRVDLADRGSEFGLAVARGLRSFAG